MKPRVIVAPDFRNMAEIFTDTALGRLSEHADIVWAKDEPMPQLEFKDSLGSAEVVIFGTWHYGDALKRIDSPVRALLEVAGAHDHLDLDYRWCLDRGLLVGSCAPAFAPAVAEMALALTLAATRGVALNDREFRTGSEHWLHDGNDITFSLFDRTVGMVGLGGISRHLQSLLSPFGVSILGYDPFLPDAAFEERAMARSELETIFESSDVVYVLAAPTEANKGLISRELMERLGPNQVLVIVSRAHLVDFDAMTELVARGRFRCATDVFPSEPLAKSHPIRQMDSAVLSAHRAGAIPDALHRIGDDVVDDTIAILTGAEPTKLQYLTPETAIGLVQPPDVGR